MIDLVLQHLDRLQSNLAAIDPTRDLAAADHVAEMAGRLRDLMRGTLPLDASLSERLAGLRRLEQLAS